MQNKENSTTNTKSFPEIWAGLSPEERSDLFDRLYRGKCCRARQTVYYWATGQKRPASPLVRDKAAAVVSSMIGERCLPKTLFDFTA